MALRSQVIEIENEVDIIESLIRFSRRHNSGVCVLSATGTVSNVTLQHPRCPDTVMALRGPFGIISLTGLFLSRASYLGSTRLIIYMARARGQVVGDRVVGAMVALGAVMIMTGTFSDAIYERLPPFVDHDEDHTVPENLALSFDGHGSPRPPY